MENYFDNLRMGISLDFSLKSLENIEHGMVTHAVLACGDREFPNDLREKIMMIIAVHALYPLINTPRNKQDVNQAALDHAIDTESSLLLSYLEAAFEEVGDREIATRFGVLADNPLEILKAREKQEFKEHAK